MKKDFYDGGDPPKIGHFLNGVGKENDNNKRYRVQPPPNFHSYDRGDYLVWWQYFSVRVFHGRDALWFVRELQCG